MAGPHDDAPLSSYSDPIYDRLDVVARQVRRQWWLFAIVLIVLLLGAIALRLWLQRNPEAHAAVTFVAADREDGAARTTALERLTADASATAFFRARAALELVQESLAKPDAAAARKWAETAAAQAKLAADDDLQLAAKLAQGAVEADEGRHDQAFTHYDAAAKAAGVRHPVRKLDGDLGAARALAAQGRLKDAADRLEPYKDREDRGAEYPLLLAKSLYWRYLREAEAVAAVPAATAAPTAP